ncbi:MAG: class I SAM-dependent methyltransferase [Vicinamibacterales bacterium]
MKALVAGRAGFEIGGPTALFARGGLLPIYPCLGALDNGNFSSQTVWEGAIHEGPTFHYDPARPPGRQFIIEASDLGRIQSEQYDVVISSHTLEHTANPLKALREWLRVLTTNGVLILVVPHKEGTFDHRRPVTRLAHLIEDEVNDTTEHDLTHLDEVLALHDLALDPPAGDAAAFRARCEQNFANRCLHHHVFDTRLAVEVMDHVGLKVVTVEAALAHHIFVIGQKTAGARPDNSRFLGVAAPYRAGSPFAGDRS